MGQAVVSLPKLLPKDDIAEISFSRNPLYISHMLTNRAAGFAATLSSLVKKGTGPLFQQVLLSGPQARPVSTRI
jgi:hypothetical protein